jgi:putative transposase
MTCHILPFAELGSKIRLMFEDEAGFGRINKPKYSWCFPGLRPVVPCHHIREYRYAYGAVEPLTGDSFFLVLPYSNTVCMNIFLQELSASNPNDYILLVCDGAAWHKAKTLVLPENIRLFFLPPATPEMNPIEQIWKELRKQGFRNESFSTLCDVVDRLCEVICSLTATTIRSITARDWIIECFQ